MEFEYINNKYNTEFTNRMFENKHIFYEIYEACGNEFETNGGSYLFDGQTYKYCELDRRAFQTGTFSNTIFIIHI